MLQTVTKSAVKSTPAPVKSQAQIIAELQAQIAALSAAPAKPAPVPGLPLAHGNVDAKFDAKTGDITVVIHTRNGKTVTWEPAKSGKCELVSTFDWAKILPADALPEGYHVYGTSVICAVPNRTPKAAKK
jgi:hypothetical protein